MSEESKRDFRRVCSYKFSLPGDTVDVSIQVPAPVTAAEYSEIEEFAALVMRGLKRSIREVQEP